MNYAKLKKADIPCHSVFHFYQTYVQELTSNGIHSEDCGAFPFLYKVTSGNIANR